MSGCKRPTSPKLPVLASPYSETAQRDPKGGCKWKEMSCWVKHYELELSVMSLIHDFHSSSKLLLLHIPNLLGEWFVPAIKLEPGHSLLLLSPARFLSGRRPYLAAPYVPTTYIHICWGIYVTFRFIPNLRQRQQMWGLWHFTCGVLP